jgi:glutathione S-transferase
MKIFRIIEQDEPRHWLPYDGWLRSNGRREPKWWERAIDAFIHSELLFLKLPLLFLNPWLRRREDWADADDAAPVRKAA